MSKTEKGALSKLRRSYNSKDEVEGEAIARTVAVGSYAVREGVARESLPCGFGEDKFQRRTVWSAAEEEQKVSLLGQRFKDVTAPLCPLK